MGSRAQHTITKCSNFRICKRQKEIYDYGYSRRIRFLFRSIYINPSRRATQSLTNNHYVLYSQLQRKTVLLMLQQNDSLCMNWIYAIRQHLKFCRQLYMLLHNESIAILVPAQQSTLTNVTDRKPLHDICIHIYLQCNLVEPQ